MIRRVELPNQRSGLDNVVTKRFKPNELVDSMVRLYNIM